MVPQIKIHISNVMSIESKNKIVQAVREIIPIALDLDEKIGQVMLYESEYRSIHESRDKNFVFVEVTMFSGRSNKFKEKLADLIISEIAKYVEVNIEDINLVYYEMNSSNYFWGTTKKYIEEL
ncbi:tautomerase family protein [Clostridium sp. SHJSY1]|uniref:tautomerase family protein n=1 Tax=Clostridium sp. SHJSY1 TaxID=2942483 RepID=UPI002875AE33|nr:tautomerase family protein [Clostridium sp. SHJSY1]MDS0525418.1 tautomerase family protein [Clostridium sp. SHJSY1]